MKKKRLLYGALSIIFGTGLIFSAVLSMLHWKNTAFSEIKITFQYPEHFSLVDYCRMGQGGQGTHLNGLPYCS